MKTGVECEYHLINADGSDISDPARHHGQALLRPAGPDAPLRRGLRDLRRHAGAGLGSLPERPRGFQRPVRDELELRRLPGHRRPPHLLQVHGEVDRREARAARDLHAQALHPPHRQRLPRPCQRVGRRRARRTCSTIRKGELGISKLGYNFLGGMHRPCRAADLDLQSDGQQLQADQRARSPPRARPGRPTRSAIPATTAPT